MLFFSGCAIRPHIIPQSEALDQSGRDMTSIRTQLLVPDKPVTVYDAMAWAIRFNRERRLRILEAALAQHQFDLAEFDMLPKLTAQAGYRGRDRQAASFSESVRTGQVSLEPSVSQDKEHVSSDITFTWNVLDFGLSYIRAKQQADRHLVSLEKKRKAVQILMRDVRRAWWEALSAQRLLKKIGPLTETVQQALAKSRRIETARLQKPMEALGHQRSLLQVLNTLQALRQELGGANARLATLMGLPASETLVLADPGSDLPVPQVPWDAAAMEQAALVLRPELGQARYQNNISRRDIHAALLGVLPGIKLDIGLNGNTDSHLFHDSWVSYGTQVTWNLFNVFRCPRAMKAARAKQDVITEQRLALSMVTLMQVHLAVANLADAHRLYALSDEYLAVQDRILQQIRATAGTVEGRQALIREELNQIVAEVRRDKAYAETQDGFGRILVSIGVDPVPAHVQSEDPGVLSEAIRNNVDTWLRRDLRKHLGLPAVENVVAVTPVVIASEVPETGEADSSVATPSPQSAVSVGDMQRQPDLAQEALSLSVAPSSGVDPMESPASVPTYLPEKPEEMTLQAAVETAPPTEPEPNRRALSPAPADTRTVTGHTLFARLHLRSGPSRNAAIIGKASGKGAPVTILRNLGDWLQVNYKGRKGFMFARYIDAPALDLPGSTLCSRIHLRNGPSHDAPIVGKTGEKGEAVAIIKDLGDWLQVRYKGYKGYIIARCVAETPAGIDKP